MCAVCVRCCEFKFASLSSAASRQVIATVFLKEPFRVRDVIGGAMVVCGVILITVFAPSNQVPLTVDQLKAYIVDTGARWPLPPSTR